MSCVIFGDFSENLIYRPNSRMLNLMSDHGFTQIVHSPTTCQGTLIDHVYYRNPSRSIMVHVKDTYYSDHDTVYCNIPFNDLYIISTEFK